MANEQEPAKKSAGRVVKKTIVKRPAATKPAPTVRIGRRPPPPAQTKKLPAARAAQPKKSVGVPKPNRELGKKAGQAGKAVTERTGKAATAVAGGVKGAAGKVGSATGATVGKVRAYRLPRMEQTVASAVAGIIIGLVTVGLAALFAMAFSELRGTSTGGGSWGSLTVVVLAFVAFALGEFILAKLHVRQPRVTSFIGVSLTLVLIMLFFLGLVDSMWALLVVPLLCAATYALAHRIIRAADSSSAQAS